MVMTRSCVVLLVMLLFVCGVYVSQTSTGHDTGKGYTVVQKKYSSEIKHDDHYSFVGGGIQRRELRTRMKFPPPSPMKNWEYRFKSPPPPTPPPSQCLKSPPPTTTITQALVPSSKTFKYVNDGSNELIPFENLEKCRSVGLTGLPNFHFYFYNYRSTPDAFYLGLALGDGTWVNRWVWTANPSNPVRDNAKLTFGSDGNLVLSNPDGKTAWQTNTANKGVVDIKLLPNGNLVLLNRQCGFVWQSFSYPSDALLVGQSLLPNQKIVGRVSETNPTPGPYSMVLEAKRLAFYYQSKSSLKPLLYYSMPVDSPLDPSNDDTPVKNVTFKATPYISQSTTAKILRLDYFTSVYLKSTDIRLTNYDSSLSFLRLGYDGNLRVFTYKYNGNDYNPWEETYHLLPVEFSNKKTLCQLPAKCGELGVCENGQCIACPTPKGMMGWSKNCRPSRLPACSKNSNVSQISYYKLVGVDHFLSMFQGGEGPMKVGQCKKKCSKDCKCVAAFYRADTSKCLITTQLNTLTKVQPTDPFSVPPESPDYVAPASDYLAFLKYAN